MQKWKLTTLFVVVLLVLLSIVLLLYWNLKEYYQSNDLKAKEKYLRDLVDKVNSNPATTWTAKYNKFGDKVRSYAFQGFKRDYSWVKEYYLDVTEFAESEAMKRHIQELVALHEQPLPSSFDAREKWSHCPSIHHIPNQGGCGSCYVVAAVSVASDRLCIHSNGTFRSILSAQDALSCCDSCGGCYGGDPLKVLTYFVKEGLVTGGRDGCKPYTVDISCGVPCSPSTYEANEIIRKCDRKCQQIYYQKEYTEDKHRGNLAYSIAPRRYTLFNEKNEQVRVPTVLTTLNQTIRLSWEKTLAVLKTEIMHYGPITLTFPITEEFLHYSHGVFRPYQREDGVLRIIYWHVVRLLGWGQEPDGSHYWLAVNSFGTHWGENGLFKMNIDVLRNYGLEYETVL